LLVPTISHQCILWWPDAQARRENNLENGLTEKPILV